MAGRRRRRKPVPETPLELAIESLSHEGRGVARVEGKTHFIDGALPGEKVVAKLTSVRGKFNEGRCIEVIEASADRVEPACNHFGVCGGCSMQHLDSRAQIAHKQAILKEQFEHFAGTQPESWMPPLVADQLHYRRKARLGVRFVIKKDKTLIGFREKYSNYLAEIDHCEVLDSRVSALLAPLSKLIAGLDLKFEIPQIEVACGDDKVALIVRHLKPMPESDNEQWKQFAEKFDVVLYLQPKGPDTVHRIWPESDSDAVLSYQIPEFGVELIQGPLDFSQVNASINRRMVPWALQLLDIQPSDNVLDLFCGLGNFTIPMATLAAQVVGVEGVQAMVERATANAVHNELSNVAFYQADLTSDLTGAEWNQRQYQKILIDPARSGALEILHNVVRFGAERIVYVSCNPATLARDTAELVKNGYKLSRAGVMDMFPHTTHVESIAVFDRTS